MHLKFLAAAGAAALMLFAPARADASCCDMQTMPCCQQKDMACCQHNDMKDMKDMPCCEQKDMPCCDKDAIEMLMAFSQQVTPVVDPQLAPAPPVRQTTDVWFKQPVLFDNKILQGHYVIEHDNDRMARGEPCTHIYAFDDRTTPVVAFHCTHLERPRASQNTAVLITKGDYKVMTEFQFAGETASHGVPDTIR